jgi:Uma2 family endonuclease
MMNNTKQFRWIERISAGIERMVAHDSMIFVERNLAWHPTQETPDKKVVPSIVAVFGRPKAPRKIYQQWEEENIAPQVVIDVMSADDTVLEMCKKLLFYSHHRVEEYYIFDVNRETIDGYVQGNCQRLEWIDSLQDWVSPRLNIRFELSMSGLTIYQTDGTPL